jgi:hypothetical protein
MKGKKMTENNTTPETATEALAETVAPVLTKDYTVLVGLEISVKAQNIYNARTDAMDLGRKLLEDVPESYRRTSMVTHEDYAQVWIEAPLGVTHWEAKHLLDWAIAFADREPIVWAEFADKFHAEDEFETARLKLMGVPYYVFLAWLEQGNGSNSYLKNYELTADALAEDAENCEDSYLGSAQSRGEFTQNYYEEAGSLGNIPSEILDAVEWDDVWSSSLQYDTTEIEVTHYESYFFRNY